MKHIAALIFVVACKPASPPPSQPTPTEPAPTEPQPTGSAPDVVTPEPDAPPTRPDPRPSAPPKMAEKCGSGDSCGPGLECVSYYGIAGARGPQFKTCEVKCNAKGGTCPDGTKCVTIADGPGQVCRK